MLGYFGPAGTFTHQALRTVSDDEAIAFASVREALEAVRAGEAKNSWLTGTAAWNFVAVSQHLLGVRADFDGLVVDPQIGPDVPTFTVGANQTVNEDAGLQTVNSFITTFGPGGGTDEAGQVISFNVTNNNNPLFSQQPAISATGVLTYQTALNAF